MFCAECGQRLVDGANFCHRCGTPAVLAPERAPEPLKMSLETIAPAEAPPKEFLTPDTPAVTAADSGLHFDASHEPVVAQAIFARVKDICLSPSTEWPRIAEEASTPRTLYLSYVAPLVAIGVIASFLGHTIIGARVPLFGTVRVGVGAGIAYAIVTFALSLVGVYLIAQIVNVLAPTFGGQKSPLAALKVTAYSYTPAWLASVLNVIPVLGILVILASFYGLYLLYLGLPVLMRSPKEKAVGYTVVTVLCAILAGIVIAAIAELAVSAIAMG